MSKNYKTIIKSFQRLVSLLWLLLCGGGLPAQDFRALVLDATTSESLPFTTISAAKADFSIYSDADGYFVVPEEIALYDTILVSYVGYATQRINPGAWKEKQTTRIQLSATAVLPVIEVTVPYQFAIGSGSVVVPSIKDLKSTPAMAGEVDPLKALSALPGISVGVEGTSALLLRGGNANQTNLLIDGVQLLNINHVGGFISAVPSFGLKSAVVYKGGMPGRFGGRLSGTVDFQFRNGRKDVTLREHTVGLGLLRTGLEGPLGKKSSFLINGRLSYPTLLRSLIKGSSVRKNDKGTNQHVWLGDALAKVTTQLGPWQLGFTIFLSGDQGYDQFDGQTLLDNISFEWSNQVYSLRARRFLGARAEWINQISFLQYNQEFTDFVRRQDGDRNVVFNQTDGLRYGRLSAESRILYHINNALDVSAGLELSRRTNDGQRQELVADGSQNGIMQTLNSASPFVQADYTSRNKLFRIMATLRSDLVSGLTALPIIQPRLRLSYEVLTNTYVNAGYDLNVQFENQLQTTVSLFPTDILLLAESGRGESSSSQVHLGVGGRIGSTVWSVEGFYKSMEGLTQIRPGRVASTTLYQDYDGSNYAFNGTGVARGLEFYVRHQKNRLRLSLAYTLSSSERRYENLNEDRTFPFTFDRPHDINAQVAYTLGNGWTANADFTFQSGIAFTAPILTAGNFDIYDGINNGRYPDFHRLNLACRKVWSAKKRSGKQHSLTFSLYNAYARKNPYFINIQIARNTILDEVTGQEVVQVRRIATTRAAFGFIPGVSYQVNIIGRK
ncbi:TonB-dependent receptor [Neolewinella antarctica]|uniref:TonB-dependent receptor plug domain-containing protein n=1 Tax=Neolewinella antarctica TaxID=442734 RepID=A0ABX0XGA5_9BACT|nr:TonB-dependent receptor plug domain-containing protein [Neolewinella antarctica]NJC28359.1 hypothetical protein [Neolewinella antarctica]